ncbi:hypothetical protein A9176_06855 [Leuconostoc garlicum]|uniref:Uncharacterized protein n=2 Tax=Leuconostoc garlicum TaxID=255248 RepID=A0ABN4WMT1_9LACO|nr:hypothetical protein A9176_06855 [Leuconostoc garlicum]
MTNSLDHVSASTIANSQQGSQSSDESTDQSSVETSSDKSTNQSSVETSSDKSTNQSSVETSSDKSTNQSSVETSSDKSTNQSSVETSSDKSTNQSSVETSSDKSTNQSSVETSSDKSTNQSSVETSSDKSTNQSSVETSSDKSTNQSSVETSSDKSTNLNLDSQQVNNKKTAPGEVTIKDPQYPNGMWLDKDASHYTFNYLLNQNRSQQLVFSTDRSGSTGVVYVYLIDNVTKSIIEQKVLQLNSKAVLQNKVTIFNDNFNGVVWSADPSKTWSREYSVNGSNPGKQYGKITYFVPLLINQTVSYVNEKGQEIIDSNGQLVNPVTQQGLTGQQYTTSAPTLVNGFYVGHYVVTPDNARGTMSQFGVPGAQYTRDFHDGYKIVFTEIDGQGNMNAKIIDSQNNIVYENKMLGKGQIDPYQNDKVRIDIVNPYVDQTRNVVYMYHQLGALVPDVPGAKPVPYPNDPTDPSKPGNPVIPNIPGYTPVDPNGKPLTPGEVYPVDPSTPGTDTPIHYTANEQKASITYIDQTTGNTITVTTVTGKSDQTSDYRTQPTIDSLTNHGYELVSDNYPKNGVVFDHDDNVDQSYQVVMKHQTKTVTPDQPGEPGQPIDPSNPNGPKYPNDTDYKALHREINQAVQYVDDKGKTVSPKVTDQVVFDRTGVIDQVTGSVTYSDWQAKNNDTTFEAKTSPIINGMYANKSVVEAKVVTADSSDDLETVVYSQLGALVPDVPGAKPVPYPNDPTDPSKPGNPVIPNIPGYTPVDPNGKPLTPGEVYPVDPSTPGTDTPIHYTANEQKASITYIDQTTGNTITVTTVTGKSDQTSDYRTQPTIDSLTNHGYELVSDNYPKNGVVFDHDDNVDQSYQVVMKHQTKTVTPDQPGEPGQPIDPSNPNGPKYPNDTDYKALHREINQAVQYVDDKGKTVSPKVTDQVVFDRTGVIDQVTGSVTYSDWQAKNNDTTFEAKTSPIINGMYANKSVVEAKVVTADSSDDLETVVYSQLGALVPDVPGAKPVPYPNDPTDPSKPGNPVIPNIPGYTPVDPNGKPLTPGEVYPVDPSTPGTDTPIHYTANEQKASITYIDQTTGNTITVTTVTGKSDQTSDYRTQPTIDSLTNHGYELVSDNYPKNGVVFDHDDNVDQSYQVVMKHQTKTVTPDQPGEPGQPIDPSNPNGPKYPNDTDYKALHREINQAVQYVDDKGKTVSPKVTDQVVFDRTGVIDQVTGSVTYSDWQAKNNDTTFEAKTSPIINGMYANKSVVEAKVVTADSSDDLETVVYSQLGALVPDVPGAKPVPYPNDPTDPSKPGNPVIPNIPGYTPVDPNGKPLTPGEVYPVDPSTPGTDTPIHYTANEQKASITYIDQTTGNTITVTTVTGKSDQTSDYRTQPTIDSLTNHGYELVSDNYPKNGVVFDHDDNVDQSYQVVMKHQTKTVTPDQPGEPGQPIDPSNPNGPKYPNDTDYKALHREINQAVQYVDDKGKTVSPKVTDQVVFDRTGVIDQVTGSVTYSDWQAKNNDTTFEAKTSPIINGMYANKSVVEAKVVTADSSDDLETVVYSQLGALVPDVPGAKPVPYPNDPTDPSKPGNPVIPNIPGYTPVDPNGKPLTPGEVYPVDPSTPGTDTPIHYTANEQKASITYIDQTTGNTITVTTVTGKSDQTSDYRTQPTIDSLTNHGYELVSDNYPKNGVVFDHDDNVDQSYQVVMKHQTKTVTPDQPGEPGQPIDPSNPNGPKYPNDTDYKALHREINQAVQYVDDKGKTVSPKVTDQVVFDRTGVIDQVTGSVTYSDWQAKNNDTTFEAKTSPIINGMYANKSVVEAKVVTADSSDDLETVVYSQLGALVPDVPGAKPVPYPNDPTDPSKPGNPVIPNIPGYTPVDPNGKPLTPGEVYPVDPSTPGTDTPIHYTANEQKASITYIDQTTGNTITVTTVTGKSDQTSDYRTQPTIDSLTNHGYELVSDNYPKNGVVFDHDDNVDQSYQVVMKHQTKTVTPDQPGEPGQPIDPSNPNGPKYPNDTDYKALHREINQAVQYVDDKGKTVSPKVTDQVVFDRTGVIDQVTGSVTYSDWQAKNNDTTFEAKTSPIINGMYANKSVVEAKVVTADSSDDLETVVYSQLGALVPDVPGAKPVPYPNDPTDPSKPGNPVIPNIPGYTPVDPNGKPLTPGEVYPVDPSTPGTDTPIHYIKNHILPDNESIFKTVETHPNFETENSTIPNHKSELPDTSAKNNSNHNLMGIVLSAALGLLGMARVIKNKNKK